MKKLSIVLLIMIITVTTVFAGSLPQEVIAIRATGDYRKMTTTGKSTESVNTLMGAGIAFDYDYYLNSYVGLFTNLGITVPLKADNDGYALEFDERDFPVYAQFGVVGRVPMTSNAGLDLRLGFGVTYDKATTYSNPTTVVSTPYAYYIIYSNTSFYKVEFQSVAGLGVYMNIDSEGSFGIRAGAMAAATFYTGIYRDNGSRYSTEVADLKRVGFEVQPYIGFTIGFNDYN